jgi:hypothetical protein
MKLAMLSTITGSPSMANAARIFIEPVTTAATMTMKEVRKFGIVSVSHRISDATKIPSAL